MLVRFCAEFFSFPSKLSFRVNSDASCWISLSLVLISSARVIPWPLVKIVIFFPLFLYKVHRFVHCALDFLTDGIC